MSVYPLTISESTIDISDFNKLMEKTEMEKYPTVKTVFERQMFGKLTDMIKSNKLTDRYIAYINDYVVAENEKAENTDAKWKYCVKNGYGFDVNNYIFTDIGYNLRPVGEAEVRHDVMPIDTLVQVLESMFNSEIMSSNLNISAEFVREYIPTISEIPDNQSLIESQYDLLEGEWATEKNDLLLVVNSTNSVTDITLALLGFIDIEGFETNPARAVFSGGDDFSMSFEQAMAKKFYFVDNDTRYLNMGENTFMQKFFSEDETAYNKIPESALTLNIKGIVRLKKDVSDGVLDTGIAYTKAFKDYILESNKNSAIVESAKNDEYGVAKVKIPTLPEKEYKVSELAGDNTVRKVAIYSVDYNAKEEIKKYLDDWNEPYDKIIAENQAIIDNPAATEEEKRVAQEKIDAAKEEQVHYSDSTAMLFAAMNTIVDAVKIILISFTAISLVVSSIMIGIITYVSVVERTKEIGVLRSLGARKKDISRIFNAETFMIGLFAGLIGVIVTYLLSIPINLIIGNFIANAGAIASLEIVHALLLVAISFILTLIA
ncbi:MAG: ABC transporter permease, partial [Clostridia bacterium]|nr:ABC transporter permease [Clostridia bacterium]